MLSIAERPSQCPHALPCWAHLCERPTIRKWGNGASAGSPQRCKSRHRCGNAAPSHTPCAGRMTGTGRSPGSRIVAVVRLPEHMLSGIVDNGSPLTVAGAASALLQPGIHARCGTPVAAAPNSLLAGSRRHLCRISNQSSGACLVNATISAAGRDADFGKASGILATVGRAG